MSRDEDIAKAVRAKDVRAIVSLFFEGKHPVLRSGFRTETQLWDYKADCPMPSREYENAWAVMAKDVLGFHNQDGGVIFYGINNDFSFLGATTRLDSKLVNDKLRRYLGDATWVEYHREFIQDDQRYLGVALIPPRGPTIEHFKTEAPLLGGERLFEKGEAAIREGDSTKILNINDAATLSRRVSAPIVGRVYAVDQPFFRIFQPGAHDKILPIDGRH